MVRGSGAAPLAVKPVLFTAEAEADVDEAFRWYGAQRPGLGAAFRGALDVAVEAVGSRPATYAIIHRNTRRVLLPKFPYGLYYRMIRHLTRAAMASGRRGPHG